jgi:hypothetical protein
MFRFIQALLIGICFLAIEAHAQANDVDCVRCVDTSDIAREAVNAYKIKPKAVTTDKLAKQAVTTSKLAPQAVTTEKIKDGAVTADKLSPGLLSGLAAPPTFKFVGFSTSQVDGSAGFFGMAAACQADFGPDSRLATTKEIVESTIQPALIGTRAWVQPVYVVARDTGPFDFSGYANPGNCTAWTDTGGNGFTVTSTGGFASNVCGATLPVACSASQ